MANFLRDNLNKILLVFLIALVPSFIYLLKLKNNIIKELQIENSSILMNNSIETNGEIYMIGNSIISSANWNELLNNSKVRNMGFSGITTLDAVMNVDKLLPDNPDLAIILLGVNDIKVNVPWEVVQENFYNLIYTFKLLSPKTRITIISILPTNNTVFNDYNIDNIELQKLNESLHIMCIKYNYQFIDCYEDFLDENGQLFADYTYDGLHLNNVAYEKLASMIKQHLYNNKNEN